MLKQLNEGTLISLVTRLKPKDITFEGVKKYINKLKNGEEEFYW